MAKKQKEKFPYKFLKPDELYDLKKLSTEELLKLHLKSVKNVKMAKKDKKEDSEIESLTKDIKKHRENHADMDEVKRLSLEIKDIKKSIDVEIEDLIADKKELTQTRNDAIKAHQEKADAILRIIDERGR